MSTQTTSISGTYAADPIHSSFAFAVRAMGVSTFRGTLDDVTATLEAGSDGLALTGAAEVESISIRTPEQFRAHVLGGQFFDAEYNASVPGALKNALDWASRPWPDNSLRDKPVCVIGASTGLFEACGPRPKCGRFLPRSVPT